MYKINRSLYFYPYKNKVTGCLFISLYQSISLIAEIYRIASHRIWENLSLKRNRP